MIKIVINYNKIKKEYQIYESSTETVLISSSLTEGLVNLNLFLKDSGLTKKDILEEDDIEYFLDSATIKSMIESNVNLLKKLHSAPSEFKISSGKFGGPNPQMGGQKKLSDFSKSSEAFKKSSFSNTKFKRK